MSLESNPLGVYLPANADSPEQPDVVDVILHAEVERDKWFVDRAVLGFPDLRRQLVQLCVVAHKPEFSICTGKTMTDLGPLNYSRSEAEGPMLALYKIASMDVISGVVPTASEAILLPASLKYLVAPLLVAVSKLV